MAILKSNYFGSPSGRIGNLVYRNVNGVTIISAMPLSRKKTVTEKSLKNEKKFGIFSSLCKAMNSIYIINMAWRMVRLKGHCNQVKQSKINYKLITGLDGISDIKLFPQDKRFSGSLVSVTAAGGIVKINILPGGGITQISEIVFPEISLHGVLKLTDNAAEDPLPVVFLPLSSAGIVLKKDIPLEFQIPIIGGDLLTYNQYPLKKFTAGMVIKNRAGEACFYSENINGEINN